MRWRVTTAFAARFTRPSYRLFVTVKGARLRRRVESQVRHGDGFRRAETDCERTDPLRLDHAFVMRRTAESTRVAEQIGCRFGRIVLVDYQPTCENMLADFAARIEADLPSLVKLHALRLAGDFVRRVDGEDNR